MGSSPTRCANKIVRWCSGLTCLPVTQEIVGSNPIRTAMNDLEKRNYYDNLNDMSYEFLTDASESTINAIPEVEWNALKNVLKNFGYTVIELNCILN